MKNKLLKKTYINFLIKIIIWTIAIPLFSFIFIIFLERIDFDWLYNYSPRIYYDLRNLFESLFNIFTFCVFVFIIWFIGALLLLYNLLKKVFSYVDAIYQASNDLLNKNIDYIELPKGLDDIQKQMNHLKRENEKNERLAHEEEQKKNDLVVYLAHDLKTPLTSMIGYLSLLDEIKDMPKLKREKYLRIALDKSYRLEDLINELFDIARFNSETIILEKETVNLGMMLEQLVDDFYPILKENDKEIKLNISKKFILNGDPDKLARVFSNLIKNAIYYSTDNLITIDVLKEEDTVKIITSNKGKQIPKAKLDKIFEKFYRADSSRTTKNGGSGLGLAIAKEIVELHGGKISATSDSEYTKFYVELPLEDLK